MESEACKGDVTEVGLEKHTGLDLRGPRQPWAGHGEMGGQGVMEWRVH